MIPTERPDGAARLGLGTVQFGLDYGVTNAAGKVSLESVRAILSEARHRGVGLLDTAALYGDSENVVGLADPDRSFSIVTKTVKVGDAGDAALAAAMVARRFEQSLRNLDRESVYGLLLHDPADLLGPFGEAVWRELQAIKSRGQARKVGVSIYTGDEIDRILSRFQPDLVQIPINAVDMRLVEGGQLEALRTRGVEVHARSVFLQGLLLQRPQDIPSKFGVLQDTVRDLHAAFEEYGLTPMEGLLAGVLRHSAISRIIVGTTSVAELAEIVTASNRIAGRAFDIDFARHRIEDPRILNPALWNSIQG